MIPSLLVFISRSAPFVRPVRSLSLFYLPARARAKPRIRKCGFIRARAKRPARPLLPAQARCAPLLFPLWVVSSPLFPIHERPAPARLRMEATSPMLGRRPPPARP